MRKYYGDFECKEDVFTQFAEYGEGCDKATAELEAQMDGINILLAWYDHYDYEGYAFVLFERNGKLYEVNGSHCSCYELAGQWEPEEVSVPELRHRMDEGTLGGYTEEDHKSELRALIESLEKKGKYRRIVV